MRRGLGAGCPSPLGSLWLAADRQCPAEVGVGQVAHDEVLDDRQSLADVALGADLLAEADAHRDVPVPATAAVEDQRAGRWVGVGLDPAVVALPVVVVDGAGEPEGKALSLLGELLAPAAPRVAVVVAPGRVGRVLLRDRPVGGVLHLGSDARAGPGAWCEAVPAGGGRPVVGDGADDAVAEPDLVPGLVAVDVGPALPLADQLEGGAARLALDEGVAGARPGADGDHR